MLTKDAASIKAPTAAPESRPTLVLFGLEQQRTTLTSDLKIFHTEVEV